MTEHTEKPNELNIDKFKEQLFEEIQQLVIEFIYYLGPYFN